MVAVAQLVGVCTVRGGSNCKNCIYYGKACNTYKARHHGQKPMDIDLDKNEAMKGWYKHENR